MTTQTMSVGDINRRLGDVPVTERLLTKLGFEAVGRDKRAVLYDQKDYPAMCAAVADYIRKKDTVPMQPRPEKEEKPAKAAKGTPAASTTTSTPKGFDEEDEDDL
jgi:hypothetical protein